jgi:uncharacterized LabA/DUF88 family protein
MAVRLRSNPTLQAIGLTENFGSTFQPEESSELYRVFFYDCPPLKKRMHSPVAHRSVNWGKSDDAILRDALHKRLNRTRKVALRLGRLSEEFASWKPKPQAVAKWIADPTNFAPTDDDFELDITQKGVDMRLGLDIASMAFKNQIDQLVMVTGDADFVPPAKLARREGIDVVLDPMHGQVARDLVQHVDGIRNCSMPNFELTSTPNDA